MLAQKGLGCPVDEEERDEPLRLQEPRLHRPAPQAGAPLYSDGRGHARQPGHRRVLDPGNTAATVWADKAYRSEEIEQLLEELGYRSRIMRKGSAATKLTQREEQGNRTKAKVRARVEHVFGSQANDMGGTLVRGIGVMRARAHIGLKNLAYNMRRFTHLETTATTA